MNVLESFFAGDVVAEEDTVGAAVEYASDGAEGFLACRVPNLEFNDLVVDFDYEAAEFDTDRDLML